MICPCGSAQPFESCCGPAVHGHIPAPTAEALMRSRYSAFALGYPQYLYDTHHPDYRGAESVESLEESCRSTVWRGLRILAVEAGQHEDTSGVVEFVAFHEQGVDIAQLRERSDFRREDGRWYYLSGQILPPLKLGRNDPCWCGSGRKLKKCHPD